MKASFGKASQPLYSDAGPCTGDVRTGLTIRLYLSQEEHARYDGPGSLRITLAGSGDDLLPDAEGR